MTVFFWLIAKELGWIHSPIIIDLIPYLGGFAVFISIVREFGKYAIKLNIVILELVGIKNDISTIKGDIKEMRYDIHQLDKRVSSLETRI